MITPRNWVVKCGPRLRNPFWCAMCAASWRNSAASIFCVSAWLRMLEATALAVRKGADPGAAWLAEVLDRVRRLEFKICGSYPMTLSVFRLSSVRASSISDMSRSAWLASVGNRNRSIGAAKDLGQSAKIVHLMVAYSCFHRLWSG